MRGPHARPQWMLLGRERLTPPTHAPGSGRPCSRRYDALWLFAAIPYSPGLSLSPMGVRIREARSTTRLHLNSANRLQIQDSQKNRLTVAFLVAMSNITREPFPHRSWGEYVRQALSGSRLRATRGIGSDRWSFISMICMGEDMVSASPCFVNKQAAALLVRLPPIPPRRRGRHPLISGRSPTRPPRRSLCPRTGRRIAHM